MLMFPFSRRNILSIPQSLQQISLELSLCKRLSKRKNDQIFPLQLILVLLIVVQTNHFLLFLSSFLSLLVTTSTPLVASPGITSQPPNPRGYSLKTSTTLVSLRALLNKDDIIQMVHLANLRDSRSTRLKRDIIEMIVAW